MKKFLPLVALISTISAFKQNIPSISEKDVEKYIEISGQAGLAAVGIAASIGGFAKASHMLLDGFYSKSPAFFKIFFRAPYACILMACSASLLNASYKEAQKTFDLLDL